MARPKTPEEDKTIKVSISFTPPIQERLIKYCQDEERSMSWVVRKALDAWLSSKGYWCFGGIKTYSVRNNATVTNQLPRLQPKLKLPKRLLQQHRRPLLQLHRHQPQALRLQLRQHLLHL